MEPAVHDPGFQLRYVSLFDHGRGFSFPSDAEGHVDLDALSDRSRYNYLFARGMVGREFSAPRVVRWMDA